MALLLFSLYMGATAAFFWLGWEYIEKEGAMDKTTSITREKLPEYSPPLSQPPPNYESHNPL